MAQARLVLASGSEWRAKLCEWMKLDFEVEVSGVVESGFNQVDPREMVKGLALVKARKVAAGLGGVGLVLGADTVVVFGGKVIGKPGSRREAREVLEAMGGKWHEVLTGVALVTGAGVENFAVQSRVKLRGLGRDELEEYLDGGEWARAAGGYKITDEWMRWVEELEGSYTNVVGLPVEELSEVLARTGLVDGKVNEAELIRENLGVDVGEYQRLR